MLKIIASEKNIKPGIYDLSIEDYHRGPGISRSSLMEFKRSPYYFWHKYINPDYVAKLETPSQLVGKAFHTLALEPDKFLNLFPAKTASQKKLFDNLYPMLDSLKRNKRAWRLIETAQIEKSLYWNDPDTGVLCKARPDLLLNNSIADLKTTKDASPWSFSKEIDKYGYHIQAAMICEALSIVKKMDIKTFRFIVIEKSAPYVTTIYKLDQKSLDKGKEEFKHFLACYKQCLKTNEWPGYEAQEISLPGYAFKGGKKLC